MGTRLMESKRSSRAYLFLSRIIECWIISMARKKKKITDGNPPLDHNMKCLFELDCSIFSQFRIKKMRGREKSLKVSVLDRFFYMPPLGSWFYINFQKPYQMYMVTACGSGQVDPSWVTHLSNTSIQKEEDGLEWRLLGAAWTSWWFIFFLRFSNRLRSGIKIIIVLFSIMRFFNLRYLIFATDNIITFVIVCWMARLCLFKEILLVSSYLFRGWIRSRRGFTSFSKLLL